MLAFPTFFRAAGVASLLALVAAATPARADCQTDIQDFMKKRDAVVAQLSAMAGSGKQKKQLDPIAACPKFKSLSGILGETVAYMEKNKDWCAIPDQLIEGAKGQRGQFAKTAAQACNIAAKVKEMKAQAEKQAAGGGGPQVQRLPAGPL